MSSKLNAKASKKDRPKSSGDGLSVSWQDEMLAEDAETEPGPRLEGPDALDKLRKGKRDGTPEKPSTPNASQDPLQEEGTPLPDRKHVLVNEEILGLAIKPEDLNKLHDPKPPSERRKTPVASSVVVRKLKPASEWDKPTPKMVTVARPAPPDADLKPFNPADGAGIRFDVTGRVVPHSILGSVEEYKRIALEEGDIPKEYGMYSDEAQPNLLSSKYEKKPKVLHPRMQSVDESNALRNWQLKMMERKRQQGYLSKLLNKPPEQLVMNQADSYRNTQELRYLVDRTIPCMDYGKGYRVGSEFWKQQERIGNDLTGVHMTLSQTERGYPPPVEHVGVPKTILEEKGSNFSRPTTPYNKPWHKNPYLQQRKQQLDPVMKELDPYQPDLNHLEVIGVPDETSSTGKPRTKSALSLLEELNQDAEEEIPLEQLDPLSEHPDVYTAPVIGPSILFAGQPARWTGDSRLMDGHVGIEARVTFEAYAGCRSTSFLEIVNDGTTAIYYDWKKLPKKNPFDLVNPKLQRFYFNNSSGVILPGDTIKFPFVFKSPNAGVFTEQWEFQTHPTVCGGAALVVTLRGVSLQEDKYKKQRSDLEQELAHKQASQIVSSILDTVLAGIRCPDRPSSPIDSYITIDEVFCRKNPGLYYHNEIVTELGALYVALLPEEDRAEAEWDLSVLTLKQMTMCLDEEDDRKQEFLHKLNSAIISLSFPAFTPTQRTMYAAGYGILCEVVDRMVDQCQSIRGILGIPDREAEELPDETTGRSSAKSTSSGKDKPPISGRSGPPRTGDGKKTATGRGSKAEVRDKKASGRDSKQPPKTPASREQAPKVGGGKITSAQKRPQTRERAQTPTSGGVSPVPTGVDPILSAKYREKMYTQTYQLISESLDQIDHAFSQAQLSDGGPKPLQL